MLEVFSMLCMNDRLRVPGISCVQFISATTAANQMTVLQCSSKAAISSQLSLAEEKMITTATNYGFFFLFFSLENKLSAKEKKNEK